MATIYGYVYLMFVTFPRVFEDQYGFSNASVGLTYLGIGVGCIFGLVFCGAVSDRLLKYLTKRKGGTPKPEYRLPAMFIGALLVPTGLFFYGWSADKKVHWIVPIIGTAFLGVGMITVFVSCPAPGIEVRRLTTVRCRHQHTLLTRTLSMLLLR